MKENGKGFLMKVDYGRPLKDSKRGWIKRRVVFSIGANEFNPRRSREKCSKKF